MNSKINIAYALHLRFGSPVVELRHISEEFFGVSPKTAQQRVNACEFPIPAFRMEDSQRSPSLVRIDDLASYLEKRYEAAKTEWLSVRG